MKVRQMFYNQDEFDALLIQPNMLQQVGEKYVDPVQTDYWNALSNIGGLFGDLPIEPNWGLLYIASNLKKNGIKTGFIDFHLYDYLKYNKTGDFINEQDIKSIIRRKKFDVVGISCMTLSHKYALQIARICKEINNDCFVVLGGIHFSFLAEETLKENDFIDAVIIGEGELIFPKIVKGLDQKDTWEDIVGLLYKDGNEIKGNDGFAMVDDIDDIPFPAYDLWPDDIPIIPRVYTARGCNGGCSYCVVNQFFCEKYRPRNVSQVIEEVKYLVHTYGIKEFLIGDLNLGANQHNAMLFCDLLIKNNLNIEWWCQTRPDGLNEVLIKKMKTAGCRQIGIGIESADQEILDKSLSQKSSTDITIRELCQMIRKHGISVQGYFILGLPGETLASALDTIDCINELTKTELVDVSHIAVLVPYPGTPIFQDPTKFDIEIIDNDYSKYLMNCDYMNAGVPVVQTSELSNYQIYALWQLALSTASRNFKSRVDYKKNDMFDNINNFTHTADIAFG